MLLNVQVLTIQVFNTEGHSNNKLLANTIWLKTLKTLPQQMIRCTKEIHPLRLRSCLTQTPNLRISSFFACGFAGYKQTQRGAASTSWPRPLRSAVMISVVENSM